MAQYAEPASGEKACFVQRPRNQQIQYLNQSQMGWQCDEKEDQEINKKMLYCPS